METDHVFPRSINVLIRINHTKSWPCVGDRVNTCVLPESVVLSHPVGHSILSSMCMIDGEVVPRISYLMVGEEILAHRTYLLEMTGQFKGSRPFKTINNMK